jgi:hypothetical protein
MNRSLGGRFFRVSGGVLVALLLTHAWLSGFLGPQTKSRPNSGFEQQQQGNKLVEWLRHVQLATHCGHHQPPIKNAKVRFYICAMIVAATSVIISISCSFAAASCRDRAGEITLKIYRFCSSSPFHKVSGIFHTLSALKLSSLFESAPKGQATQPLCPRTGLLALCIQAYGPCGSDAELRAAHTTRQASRHPCSKSSPQARSCAPSQCLERLNM